MKKPHFNSKYHNILTKDFLIKEYIVNKKSTYQIAKEIGCSHSNILNYLKKYNIKTRTQGEALKGKYIGKKCYNYIDGRTYKTYYCKEMGCDNEITMITALYHGGRCQSCANFSKWKDPKFREKITKAILKSKNIITKPEKLLNKILPKAYKFVGNGKLIIAGFCPDFVNKENNKIIELFGCYWHKCKKCGFGDGRSIDIGRLKAYNKAGYKTLIIWEHELKDLDKIKGRILEFNKIKEMIL